MWNPAPGERSVHRSLLRALLAVLVLASVLTVASSTAVPPAAATSGSGFVAMAPQRVLDTRVSRPIGEQQQLAVSLAGVVPAGATAVVLNVTGTRPSASTFLTVWPTGRTRPTASNLNLAPGQTRPNSVLVGLGAHQTINVYNDRGATHVLIDVMGWYTHGFTGTQPTRIMDTRAGLGAQRLGPATTQPLLVRGRHGIPSTAVALALNVTATGATDDTFLTVWPERERPNSSNLNVRAGTVVPNLAVVGIGADGHIRFYNDRGHTHVIADLMGWFDASGGLVPLSPSRALDTRLNTCGVRLGPGETRTVRLTGRTDRSGAVINVTAVGATQPTFITVWPTGQRRPDTSNLNVAGSQPTANLVKVGLGDGGQVNLYNDRGSTHLLVDLYATTTGATPSGAVVACPEPPPVTTDELLLRPDLQRMLGHDRVAVWVCVVPSGSTHSAYRSAGRLAVDGAQVAAWANQTVSPYVDRASRGRYRATFTALGRITLDAGAGPSDCRHEATRRTGSPYTNVLATDTSDVRSGVSSVGRLGATDLLEAAPAAPSATGRSMWVGGGSTVATASASVIAHELGHTLHWPHSTAGTSAYDNWVDLMSGWPKEGWCNGARVSWPCVPQHTLAVNRLAAGWIDDHELDVHRAGTTTALLSPPAAGGIQMLAIPAEGGQPVFVAAEARARVGDDALLDKEGVALHIVDQRDMGCWTQHVGGCISTGRLHTSFVPSRDGRAHVLGVGESLSAHGITVLVTARFGHHFEVRVSGTFRAPPG